VRVFAWVSITQFSAKSLYEYCKGFVFIGIFIIMDIKQLFKKHILLYESINFDNFTLEQSQLNNILKGYLEAALWTEEERLSDDYKNNLGYDESEWNDEDDNNEIENLIRIKQNFENTPFEKFIVNDLENDSKIQAYLDIKTFIKNAGVYAVTEAVKENGWFKLGMDIWLTRNHHGAGFFDNNYDSEELLTNAAQNLKEVDLYVTDNNTLAFSNA